MMTSHSSRAIILMIVALTLMPDEAQGYFKRDDKTKCPQVKYMKHFDQHQMEGEWFVSEYYTASEEAASYKCMRSMFSWQEPDRVHMNFTYMYRDDPDNERLVGNITWVVPDLHTPAHWRHAEQPYEGIYNTYVVDTDYTGWSLLLHCADKAKSPRYLTALMMSRSADKLKPNVAAFLRDKLLRYQIDLEYLFPMDQKHCSIGSGQLHYKTPPGKSKSNKKSPMKAKHRQRRDKTRNHNPATTAGYMTAQPS